MLIFEFQEQHYISLHDALTKVLKLPLESVVTDITNYLCFFYQDTVIYNGETAGFQGFVFPESDLMMTDKIKIALDYMVKYKPMESLTLLDNDDGTLPKLKDIHKKTYQLGFINTGACSSNNALLLGQKIVDSDFFQHRETPSTVFYLRQSILPYHLLPFEFLKSYINNKGIVADLSMLKSLWSKPSIVPASRIIVERGDFIADTQPRLTGDSYKQYIQAQKQQIQALESQITTLQAELSTSETASQQTRKFAELKSLPKQREREVFLEKLLSHMEQLAIELNRNTLDRQNIRTTKKSMFMALQKIEFLETNKNVLFSISDTTFNDFWKQQKLCSLAQGKNISDNILIGVV